MDLAADKTLIMGVLNVTPDSFSDGGKFIDVDKAVAYAKQMVSDGAFIIDVGGESSRPGSDPISEEEELKRVIPVIEKLVDEISVPISIDSTKPTVVKAALEKGASIVNDINGLRDDEMISVVASFNVPVIIMHMQGSPKSMQDNPSYTDVVSEVKEFLQLQASKAEDAGISTIILDPGIGFGKKLEDNLKLIKHLDKIKELGYPVMVGASRKSFIEMITGAKMDERIPGTLAAHSIAVLKGADILRVHDVKEAKQAAEIVDAIKNA